MDDGPSSEKRSYCACAVGFLCCWLVVGLPPWIVFANYQAQMTCDTLRSMQPELCWRGTWWGWQEGSEGSGFTALECCRGPPVATVTMTSVTMTSTTMTLTTLPAIPYCQCEAASSSALQCETGAGRSCITNLTDWTACFFDGGRRQRLNNLNPQGNSKKQQRSPKSIEKDNFLQKSWT